VRRLFRFLLRNWPLKLAAVLLATMLYTGLVLSQNERIFTDIVPVDVIRPPAGATLLADIEPVREIRFRAPLDVGILSPDSFRATVDLSRIEARQGGEAQDVPVTLVAIDRRVQIVDFSPRVVQVRLDFVEERQLPIRVEFGTVPEGISIGTPQTDPTSVTLRGPSSRVSAVRFVVARVTIDASALNIDRDVELLAVDDQGNHVPRVEIDPTRARVRIPVALELANRTLPVVPNVSGTLVDGHQITSIAVDPLTVTVEGSAAVVNQLDAAMTQPIDVSGRTRDFEVVVGLDLPDQAQPVGSGQVRVTVAIVEVSGSRSFMTGLTLTGARPDLTYRPAVTQLVVTLQGPLGELNSLDVALLSAQLEVAELEPGVHAVSVTVTAPAGLEILSVSPDEVLVRVEEAAEAGSSRTSVALLAGRL
jgi:YbbR domain-containing protein